MRVVEEKKEHNRRKANPNVRSLSTNLILTQCHFFKVADTEVTVLCYVSNVNVVLFSPIYFIFFNEKWI
jgi:hypothetical protein